MNSPPLLSVLDATAIGPGVTATQALEWTTQIAQLAEKLNYHRLWVVEHHNVSDIGGCSPAVLIAHLAANTHNLRIGSGGVMLPNHSPLVIAEQFRTLQGLYPGRIDLGIGKARGTDEATNLALHPGQHKYYQFERHFDDLECFLNGSFPIGHAFENIKIALQVESPPVFVLGSGEASAHMAAKRGLPFAFAHHLNPDASHTSVTTYKNAFQRSDKRKAPHAIVTVAVVCADTYEEAYHAAMWAATIRLRRAAIIRQSLNITNEALLYPHLSDIEQALAEKELTGGWILVGSREQVWDRLMDLQKTTTADELMLTTIEYDGPSRMRTLKAIGDMINHTEDTLVEGSGCTH